VTAIAFIISGLLILQGLITAFITGDFKTALIPSYVGVFFAILTAVSLKASLHKHVMHALMLFALLLSLGGLGMGLPKLPTVLGGQWTTQVSDEGQSAEMVVVNEAGEVINDRPVAPISQTIMGLLCLGLLGAGVKSFIDTRKKQRAEQQAEASANAP
jgi:hypothetical protein